TAWAKASFRRRSMRYPIVKGAGLMALLLGLAGAEVSAQYVSPGSPTNYPRVSGTPAYQPGQRAYSYPRDPQTVPTRAYAFQDQPATGAPPTPETNMPVEANTTDLAAPKAEKEGGGGEPTTVEEEKEE